MKMIGEILTDEQIADLASIMPNAGNAILELTENQLDFLKGYIKSCKILNQSSRTEIMLAKAKSDAERIEVNGINLIDREAAADILEAKSQMSIATDAQIVFAAAARMIRRLPAVGEKLVRHAKWMWDDDAIDSCIGAWVCSDCKQRNENIHAGNPNTDRDIWAKPNIWSGTNYCPNCGARMDSEG